jgi:hypothetical protein
MKRMSVLSVCLVGLLQAGPSLGADCAALPSDSVFQTECRYLKNRLAAPSRPIPAQLIGGSESPQVQGTRYRPRGAAPATRFRKQGAEPPITIFLTSGSTILVDQTWVRRDRLFYTSRGVGGGVALRDVIRLEDIRLRLRPAPGR